MGKINLIRGDTFIISLSIRAGDTIIPFIVGDTVTFTVKETTNTKTILIQKAYSPATNDMNVTIELEPDDTVELNTGEYVYDVEFKRDGAVYTVIKPNEFNLLGGVTWDSREKTQ